MKHDYYMYVLYIDYNEDFIKQFDNIRSLLLDLNSISFKFLEKDKLEWIDLEYIKENKDCFRCVFYKSLLTNLDQIIGNA